MMRMGYAYTIPIRILLSLPPMLYAVWIALYVHTVRAAVWHKVAKAHGHGHGRPVAHNTTYEK